MKKLLNEFKKLNLPKGEYLIYGSGPLGIREIRKIHDLDIIVKDSFYRKLLKKYKETKCEMKRFIKIKNIELIPVSSSLIKNFNTAYKRADEIE